MKRFIFTSILLASAACSFAQNRIGLELGAGRPVFATGSYSSATVPGYDVDINLAGTVYYTRKFARHWYVGVKSSFEQYSFSFSRKENDGLSGTIGTNVKHKSSYLHFGPMIDLGVGRHHEYLHFYSAATVGFLLTGFQETEDYHETFNLPDAYHRVGRTDAMINPVVFRFSFGLRQQFTITKTWQATINEGYSAMPFGDVSQPTSTGGNNLHPGYITLQFGMMHKFKDAKRANRDN